MKTKLLALALLAGSAAIAGPRVFFGVGVGAPVYAPMPAVPMAAYVPPAPGPGYSWWAATGIRPARAGLGMPAITRHVRMPALTGPRRRWSGGRYYAGHWRR